MATRPATQHEMHHNIDIGLTDKQREGSIEVLNTALADLHVLYIKTHKFHWNVIGPDFYMIHKMLDEQYEELAEHIDVIAERVRMVGGRAIGTMQEFTQRARLQEEPGEYPNARDMLHTLLHDHEAMIRHLREDIDTVDQEYEDATTADILTQLAEVHEKIAWMLGSTVADDHSLDTQTGRDGNNARTSKDGNGNGKRTMSTRAGTRKTGRGKQ